MNKSIIKGVFEKRFGNEPIVCSSPGRINLIGEHTDYNDGFVLPAAIDKYIYFAVAPNKTNSYNLYSYNYDEEFSIATGKPKKSNIQWLNYLLGVIAQFHDKGFELAGFDCVFGGNLPSGAGISSSAAIECGLAYTLNKLFKTGFSSLEIVLISQKAEHEYAGVKCGIMDQFAVVHAKEKTAIKLDCRSLSFEYVPFDTQDYCFVLVNTGVKHSLASSEYNKRRQECERGVEILKKIKPDILALRDAYPETLKKYQDQFDETIFKRCSFVVEENARVVESEKYLKEGNFQKFGKLMYLSHQGLKNDYEVSCRELDTLVDLASGFDGVLGARMMGAGFGGCTLNLIEKDSVSAFKKLISCNYKTPDGKIAEIIEANISEGTKIEI
jgi:galactokinase